MFGVRTKISGMFGNGEAELSVQQGRDAERSRFDEETDINEEKLAHLLSNRRRNLAIGVVCEDHSLTINDLAEIVAFHENVAESDTAEIEDLAPHEDHVEKVVYSLRQTHIPKLEEYDVVRYEEYEADADGEPLIRPGNNGEATYRMLDELTGACSLCK